VDADALWMGRSGGVRDAGDARAWLGGTRLERHGDRRL